MNSNLSIRSLLIGSVKHYLYSSWSFAVRYAAEKRRWQGFDKGEKPRLYYGHDFIPDKTAFSSGAIIKFQDLNIRFPNTVYNANILYLVNSALPMFPEIMVKEAKRHGVLFVLNQNGVAYPAWHGPGWKKTNRPNRFLLKKADYVIYQSEFSKAGADKFLMPCQVNWTILHNPVDTKVFVPSGVQSSEAKILLAGSHQHLYRIKTALETLKLVLNDVPSATLTIAGRYAWKASESECLSEARSLAWHLDVQDSVEFCGGYTQAEAPGLIQKHQILLHTQYNDCCPRLVVEAMACGVPVVYSSSGGVPELVGADAGVGVFSRLDWENEHPPRPSDLAGAICQLFKSLSRYSESARERAVKYFDVELWMNNHSAIFYDLLQKRH